MKGPVIKTCGHCGQTFECGQYGCWCGKAGITEWQMDWIAVRFEDCLCQACLQQVSLGKLGPPYKKPISRRGKHVKQSTRNNGKFSGPEREAVYRAIFERRDVRRNFLPSSVPDDVLARLLTAAHHAGSVGFMQPWDFVVVRQPNTKRAVKTLFREINAEAAARYTGARAELYRSLKLEGIEEAPVNLCVTCTKQRGGRHVLGRSTVRDTDLYSTCCAIQNLWLAARAEGIGMGWVSILDHAALKRLLGIPKSVTVLAYLCLGYVSDFSAQPDLEVAGWRARLPVEQLVHYESWGNRMRDGRRNGNAHHQGLHEDRRHGKNEAGRRAAGLERQPAGRGLRHGG